MKLSARVLAASCLALAACGGSTQIQPDAGEPDAGHDAGEDAGQDSGTDAGQDAGTDAGQDAGTDAGQDAGTDAGLDAGSDGGFHNHDAAMPIISQGVPAYASSADQSAPASKANDTNPGDNWSSTAVPAWLAYDLSGASAAARAQVLVAWYAPRIEDYLSSAAAGSYMPLAYTIEVNAAAGGGSAAPATGWTQVVGVTGNVNSGREHLISMAGQNWVRVNVSSGSDTSVQLDMDVHSAPSGPTDAWLFMGDSITFISLPRAFSDLPALVQQGNPAWYPAIIDAAEGGTNTVTAMSVIDLTMANFPGQYVALNYGTNDDDTNFQMEALVQHVFAAGKVPVVPHMPWSDQSLTKGPIINADIDALYVKYPAIVPGPDLWAVFLNRTDLIPPGDVHPNSAGQEVYRQTWADFMKTLEH